MPPHRGETWPSQLAAFPWGGTGDSQRVGSVVSRPCCPPAWPWQAHGRAQGTLRAWRSLGERQVEREGIKMLPKATTASCHLGQVGTSSLCCLEKPSHSFLLLHQQSKRSLNPAQPPPTALSQSYCSFSTKETNLLCRRAGQVINEKLCSI